MKLLLSSILIAAAAGTALARESHAVEGKWTPQQVLEHDPKWLRELGLEIPPEHLWSQEGAGLLDAAVKVAGCSSGFVSADGLLITNHHCAFSILQQHSTPERDLITDGFLARTRAEELPGGGVRATLPHLSTDVTAEVLAAIPAGADDLARFRATERKMKEMVAACEKQPNRRCQVEAFDGGVCTACSRTWSSPTCGWSTRLPGPWASTAARSTTGAGHATPATSPCCGSTPRAAIRPRRPLPMLPTGRSTGFRWRRKGSSPAAS